MSISDFIPRAHISLRGIGEQKRVRHFVTFILLALATLAHARSDALPPEVAAFIGDRDACDHFRGEPSEGNSHAQIKRRAFIVESLEIFCPGSDRRLAALRKRYKDNADVMRRLNSFEENIEGNNAR